MIVKWNVNKWSDETIKKTGQQASFENIYLRPSGGCGSLVRTIVLDQKVGDSIPVFPSPHAEVSFGKILNPKFPFLIEKVLHIDALL